MQVKLEKTLWELGQELAGGGFAKVVVATSEHNANCVAKLVPKVPGAARELLFEELNGLPNIIPILDRGETDDCFIIIMPRADKSLRDHLTGNISTEEALAILADIARGLSSVESQVVHRDLKPENILLLDGKWCLADFGIARYVEATTAADTRKYSMTAPYAAPEQWRFERATSATDVYAFGVIAYELLAGRRPFSGPDFREQHLNESPPPMEGIRSGIAGLIGECLYKPAAARPTAANVLARLATAQAPLSPSGEKLRSLSEQEVQRKLAADAQASRVESREHNRRELYELSKTSLRSIMKNLSDKAKEYAPNVSISTSPKIMPLRVTLQNGQLVVENFEHSPYECLAYGGYQAPFDVVSYTSISARKPRDRYDYGGRAHSLWFCDAQEEGVYRWYELAFMYSGLSGRRFIVNPTALSPTEEQVGLALCPYISGELQVAWQPIPIDQGEEEPFIERWLGWFADAVDGTLSHPHSMPESSGGRYRYPPTDRRKT